MKAVNACLPPSRHAGFVHLDWKCFGASYGADVGEGCPHWHAPCVMTALTAGTCLWREMRLMSGMCWNRLTRALLYACFFFSRGRGIPNCSDASA